MTQPPREQSQDILLDLGIENSAAKRHRWVWISAAITASVLIAAALLYASGNKETTVRYRTAPVTRGALTVTVTATGVLEPVKKVDVGSEISGTVETVVVDFNDRVKVGQTLAQLNTNQLDARLRQSQAALELARASVREAEATVTETRNKLRRSLELRTKGLCSPEECDAAQSAFDRAEASRARTAAQVTQAQAQLDVDRTALAKARIISPINGIVLKRQIEPGQTVAASFQTPVLFTLAENLALMELQVAVDEADVGLVSAGQQAKFTVDAYQDRVFSATVTQVRFAPETVNGVVTYGTVLSVDNKDLLLRPGMTATAVIVVQQLENTLLVPNAALRFTPPLQATGDSRGLVGQLFPRRPREEKKKDTVEKNRRHQVWVLQKEKPASIPVTLGATDGVSTQVLTGELEPGTEVVLDVMSRTR